MTCDELELLFPDGAAGVSAQQHLAGCDRCRASVEVLSMAAQPGLKASETALLVGMPSAALRGWLRLMHRRSLTQRFVGLAIAASLGAVIATGTMWKLNAAPPEQFAPARPSPEVLVLMEDSSPVGSEDDSSFEVSWPSLNDDGDVL